MNFIGLLVQEKESYKDDPFKDDEDEDYDCEVDSNESGFEGNGSGSMNS
jgi:hypothetical protein